MKAILSLFVVAAMVAVAQGSMSMSAGETGLIIQSVPAPKYISCINKVMMLSSRVLSCPTSPGFWPLVTETQRVLGPCHKSIAGCHDVKCIIDRCGTDEHIRKLKLLHNEFVFLYRTPVCATALERGLSISMGPAPLTFVDFLKGGCYYL